jgi:putative peptidoglycan lipid II flippase
MQALILIPVLIRTGYRYSVSWQWRGLGLTKAFNLAIWTIGLVAANQVAFVVISRLATQANVNALEAGLPPAGLATYQTGYLIFILPHSVITVSIVTALLPSLSRTVHAGRLREAGDEISRAARVVVLLVAPVSVALFMLAPPIASLLFGYGAADAEQINQLGIVTRIFALAILPFTVYYILLRGWYAMEDTRTPFYLAVVLNIINIGFAIGLFQMVDPGAQQIYALAAAFVIAYWSILLVGWPLLARRFGGLDTLRTVWTIIRVVLASLVAMAAAFAVLPLTEYDAGDSKLDALIDVAFIALVVLVVYAAAVWLFRIGEAKDLTQMITGRLRRR